MATNGSQLLTKDEAAKRLGVSRSTVDRLVRSRELPSVKLGGSRRAPRRIRPVDLEQFVAAHREGGTP